MGLPISVVEEWGESLPFQDNSFDLVICRQVLHHAYDLKKFCKEAGRILKPGGCFLAAREHVISTKEDLSTFLDSHPLHRIYGGENAFMLAEYLEAIELGGMTVRSVFNPFESNINLYPHSKQSVKKRWARKLRLPIETMIPDLFLTLRGKYERTPGRIYSFVAYKRS
jgi:SAM-dependent methyltransferase